MTRDPNKAKGDQDGTFRPLGQGPGGIEQRSDALNRRPARGQRPPAPKRRDWRFVVGLTCLIIGIMAALYPFVSQIIYQDRVDNIRNDYMEALKEMPDADREKRLDLARAYNEAVDPSLLADAFTPRQKEGIDNYAHMLEVEEKIAFVEIPKIGQNLPVYAGTSESVLQKGCGHLQGSSLPVGGTDTHCVITAHRGLPSARLFTDLDKLEEGDIFIIHSVAGDLYYQVDHVEVIEPDDLDKVMIIPGQDYVTLLTCTPYMINTQRLIVRGKRIADMANLDQDQEKDLTKNQHSSLWQNPRFRLLVLVAAIILLVLLFTFLLGLSRRSKNKRRQTRNE